MAYLTLLSGILCTAIVASREAYFGYFARDTDESSYYPLSRPVANWPIQPTVTHITTPLTRTTCTSPHYRSLRACRLNETLMSELASEHLCNSRDEFRTISVRTRRRTRRYAKPCSGTRQRVAVLQAKDELGRMRELVTDRRNHLYQTLVIEKCPKGDLGGYGLRCRQHSITFLAAVFPTNSESNQITVEYVSTPAYCALSFY